MRIADSTGQAKECLPVSRAENRERANHERHEGVNCQASFVCLGVLCGEIKYFVTTGTEPEARASACSPEGTAIYGQSEASHLEHRHLFDAHFLRPGTDATGAEELNPRRNRWVAQRQGKGDVRAF